MFLASIPRVLAIFSIAVVIYLTAICIYHLFFHPYAKYPGPFWAKISPLYSLWHAYAGDLHIDVLRCHEKYGHFVRYAPDRVVVNTVSGLRAIYGQGRNLQKSKGYRPHPYFPTVFNTHNCIDKGMHGRKRRIVSQGFSETTLASSEQYVLQHVRNLCAALMPSNEAGSKEWSSPRDMAMWTNYFTLDVISDLTFGQAFNMVGKPDLRWLVEAIVNGNRHIYLRFAYPALFNIKPDRWYSPARWLFPRMAEERARFSEVADKCSEERMALVAEGKSDRQDIMTALLAARDPKTGEKLSMEEVWGEAHLMIAAGGDTTSTALAAVFFYLSRNAEVYAKLASEIRSTFFDVESIRRGPALISCHYLRACIDEALRLAPAAPGALWREVCPGGAMIDGNYVPVGLDLAVCTYAVSHNPEYFPEPYKFDPERFLNQTTTPQDGYFSTRNVPTSHAALSHSVPNHSLLTPPDSAPTTPSLLPKTSVPSPSTLIPPLTPANTPSQTPSQTPSPMPHTNKPYNPNNLDAFSPFAIGPRSCLAKPLAYLELSLALARVLYLMDFEAVDDTGAGGFGFWAGKRGREKAEEFQITDMFSSNKIGPVLRFRER